MAQQDNIHKGHRERVRRRFENEGLSSFEPHEALELLLYYSVPQRDTNSLAHRLLARFGSIDKVFDAELSALMAVDGIGYNTAVLMKLIPEMAQFYIRERYNKRVRLSTVSQMGEFFCSKIGLLSHEVFAAAALDAKRNVIAFDILSEGYISQTSAPLRTLAEFALGVNAEMIIISHNHVSGDLLPSYADRETTKLLFTRLREIGVEIIDHIIVSGENYYSLAANGIMPI